MKNILPILFLLILQGTAFAVTSHLEINVNSQGFVGPLGYGHICGVRIKHQGATDAMDDLLQYSWNTFNFRTGTEAVPIPGEIMAGVGTISGDSPGGFLADNGYANPVKADSQKQITSIKLDLSSTYYGVEWDIDVCHRRLAPSNNIPARIKVSVAGANGLILGANYITDSGLTVKSLGYCEGNYSNMLSTSEITPVSGLTELGILPTLGRELYCTTTFSFKENSLYPRKGKLLGNFLVHTDYDVLY